MPFSADSPTDPMREIKFWFWGMIVALLVVILAPAVLRVAGVSEGQTATVFTLIIGFAGVIGANFKVSIENKRSAEKTARMLEESDRKRAAEAKAVEDALKAHTDRGDKKMDQSLRVADGALGRQKKIAADALRVIADRTRDPAHIANADTAERDYLDHEENQRRATAAATGPDGEPKPVDVKVVNLDEVRAATNPPGPEKPEVS